MSIRDDIFYQGDAGTVPSAWCWVCKADVVVYADFAAGERPAPRCLVCDQRLDEHGVEPGLKRVPVAPLARALDLEVFERLGGGGCGTGGGCATGGCAEKGGGGGCWTAAVDGRAAEEAQSGVRGCASCGVKTECADVARHSRAGDLDAARLASDAKREKKRLLEALPVHPEGGPNFYPLRK